MFTESLMLLMLSVLTLSSLLRTLGLRVEVVALKVEVRVRVGFLVSLCVIMSLSLSTVAAWGGHTHTTSHL